MTNKVLNADMVVINQIISNILEPDNLTDLVVKDLEAFLSKYEPFPSVSSRSKEVIRAAIVKRQAAG